MDVEPETAEELEPMDFGLDQAFKDFPSGSEKCGILFLGRTNGTGFTRPWPREGKRENNQGLNPTQSVIMFCLCGLSQRSPNNGQGDSNEK